MIRSIHFVLFVVFFIFAFYINIVVVVVGFIVGTITVTTGISRDRLVVDLRKKELCFVIYKGLEGFKDYNIICCLVSIYQIEI